MAAAVTLKRYIRKCEEILLQKNIAEAETLQNEIISIFSDIDNIRGGLSNYSPVFAMSFAGNTVVADDKVDYLSDLNLLKNKLQAELEKIETPEDVIVEETKRPKILISHASKDIGYVQLILNLFEDIGLTNDEVVCSSVPGYGIPLGADIYDWLASQFQEHDLYIIFALSEQYYRSPACLNEMGAAWVLKQDYDSILLPGFDYKQIAGAVNPNRIALKLDDKDTNNLKHRLLELKDKIVRKFSLRSMSETKWERNRDEFLRNVEELTNTMSENNVDEEESQEQTRITKDAAVLLIYAANSDTGEIVITRSLSGTSVAGGQWNFVDPQGNAREEARWEAVIGELEALGLIEAVSYKRQIFKVTHSGFAVADDLNKELSVDCNNSPDVYLHY